MRWVVPLLALAGGAGCVFQAAPVGAQAGGGAPPPAGAAPPPRGGPPPPPPAAPLADAPVCWPYPPTNFDPCLLPAATGPIALDVLSTRTFDTSVDAGLPNLLVTQADGTLVRVVHVTAVDIPATAVLSIVGGV